MKKRKGKLSDPVPDAGRTDREANSLCLLVLDRDRATGARVEEALAQVPGETYAVEWFGRLAGGLRRLGDAKPVDVILLSLDLPDGNGTAAVAQVCEAAPAVPVVALLGADEHDAGQEAMQTGACEYLPQDQVSPFGLSRTIRFAVERCRGTDRVREAEMRFRNVIEHASAGYFRLDREGNFQEVNSAWLRMHGYESEAEVLGLHFLLGLLDKDVAEGQERFCQALRGDVVAACDQARRCKDGSIGYGIFSAGPVRDGRRIVGVEGFVIDVTESKRACIALDVERRQLLSVFDSIDQPIYVSDPETYEVLYANKALTRRFGPASGKKCFAVFQEQASPCPFCTNKFLFGNNVGRPYIWEMRNEKNKRWYRCIDRAIRWTSGKSVRCEIAFDITELKNTTAQLSRRNAELDAINSVVEAIGQSLDLSRLLQTSLEAVCSMLHASAGLIYLLDEKEGIYKPVSTHNVPRDVMVRVKGVKVNESMVGVVAESEQVVIISDRQLSPERISPAVGDMAWSSYAAAPILCKNKVVGVIELVANHEDTFSPGIMGLLRDLCKQIGLGIDNARLYAEALSVRQALAEHDEKVRSLFELSPMVIVITDLEGKVRDVNPRMQQWLDYLAEEVVGQTFEQLPFLSEQSREVARRQHSERNSGRNCPPYELEFTTRRGETRVGRILTTPLRGAEGKAVGELAMIADVTDLREAEIALRRDQELMARITMTAPMAIVVSDRNGRTTFANSQAEYALGRPREEILHHVFDSPDWEIASTDGQSLPTDKLPFAVVRETGEPVAGFCFWVRHADGTRALLSVNAAPLFDDAGKFDGMVASIQNITERVQVVEALADSEERYRALVDNMSSGVAVYEAMDDGRDFVLRDLNRASECIEHVIKDQVVGKRVTEVFPGVENLGLLEVFRTVWKTGEPAHHPIGQYRDHRLTGWRENYVYRLPSGEIVAVYDDKTVQKMAEQRMEHLHAVLRAIRNVNQLIVREHDRARLLQGACDRLVESGGYHGARIVLRDETGQLSLAAESGFEQAGQKVARKVRQEKLPRCVRTAVDRYCQTPSASNIQVCAQCPLDQTPGVDGMAACLSHEDHIDGLLCVAVPADLVTEEEKLLLTEVADDIAEAVGRR